MKLCLLFIFINRFWLDWQVLYSWYWKICEECLQWTIFSLQYVVSEDNIKSRLLKIFKSRKWKKKFQDSDDKLKSPFRLPKCKVTKDDNKVSSETANSWKSYKFPSQRPSIFRPVRRVKSCPMDKPESIWEDIRNLEVGFSWIE